MNADIFLQKIWKITELNNTDRNICYTNRSLQIIWNIFFECVDKKI